MKCRPEVYKWLNNAQAALLPPVCELCGAAGEAGRDLCHACLHELIPNLNCCYRCAAPLPVPGLCGACQKKTPHYDSVTTLYLYAAPLSYLILGLKFARKLHLARLLGELAAPHFNTQPQPDLIIPVPLHAARLRERGFNQSLEIARFIARDTDTPLDRTSLHRTKATEAQTRLHEKERQRNVRGAFALGAQPDARHVVLFDDVVTTGATINECARVLKRAGIERVDVWAVARAPHK